MTAAESLMLQALSKSTNVKPDPPALRTQPSETFSAALMVVTPPFLSVSQKNRHERTQCLARPGSGAVRQPDGKYALFCSCGVGTPFYSTRALAIHKARSPH